MEAAGVSEGKWARNIAADIMWLASAGALIVTGACNFAYGWTQGTDDLFLNLLTLREIKSGIYVVIDIAAASFAAGAYSLYLAKSWFPFFFVAGASIVFGALSLIATMGFLGMENAKVEAGRMHSSGSYAAQVEKIDRYKAELKWVPHGRPADTVAELLNAAEADALFKRSKSCTDATLTDSIGHCDKYRALKVELANAGTRSRLTNLIVSEQAKLDALKPVAGDTFAAAVHDLFGVKEDSTSKYQPFALAVGAWLLAVFGFACSDAVRASGRVQAASSPLPVLTVERPPVKTLPLPVPAETAPEAPTAPEPIKALSAPAKKKTAARQAPDSPGQPSKAETSAEEWVARWAWGLRPGVYTIADLRQSWGEFVKQKEKAGGAIPAVHKSKIGEALEALGYEKFRDPGNERKTSFRFPKDERIVAGATSARRG